MTMTVPLSVRLTTTRGSSNVTRLIEGVTFGAAVPGGYTDCRMRLSVPITTIPDDVTQFGMVTITDGRHGGTVWAGRVQDPGRTGGVGGEQYELAAVGGSAHTQDDKPPLIYVDNDLTAWTRTDVATPAATVDVTDAGGTSALVLRIPQGTSVDGAIPSRAVAAHEGIAAAGLTLARVSFAWDSGLTSASITAALYAATTGVGSADIAWSATFNVAGGTISRVVGTNWTLGRNRPLIRFHYTGGAASVSADTWWLQINDLAVRTIMYGKDGVERTAAGDYTTSTVLASEVVADLLGRVLAAVYDGPGASIATTTYGIDKLTYPDGVTPRQVLDDLMLLEPAYYWAVWEPNRAGKFRFEWTIWPGTVRYEASTVDGFAAPASGNTLYDRVRVRGRDSAGQIRQVLRTQTVPTLAAAGFSRTELIDLGDEVWSTANAQQAGDQFLAEHRYPVNAGTLTVRRPVLDLLTGRMVSPWEIRPGTLIRVRGVQPYPDALNPGGRNGATVFRIAATSYSTDDAAATLALDAYPPSVARALADIMRRQPARRR